MKARDLRPGQRVRVALTCAHGIDGARGRCAVALRASDGTTIGTFRWQQQPFCNVFTLAVEQKGSIYTLYGFDDQCGAPARAAVGGTGFLNPDGSIGMGLTLVAAPGGTPLHLDVRMSLSTVSGTWRDSTGQNDAWALSPGPPAGGGPRPALVSCFLLVYPLPAPQ